MKRYLVISGKDAFAQDRGKTDGSGRHSYADLLIYVTKAAFEAGVIVDFFQSDHEDEISWKIEFAHGMYDGVIINAAASAFTGDIIRDAIRASDVPCVEVLLPDTLVCGESILTRVCIRSIAGSGLGIYKEALAALDAHSRK